MRTLTVYRHGLTMGTPPRTNSHNRVKRGAVSGWSTSATRRNLAFLRSVDERAIESPGFTGWAITLTVRHCPPSADVWHKMRRAFLMRLDRAGLLRSHWVTEWQRRGVPHLHGVVYLPADLMPWEIINHWLAVAEPCGCTSSGQHVAPITDAVGWLKYLAKHAARGVHHYQRSPESVPSAWQGATGRVWGHTGQWPLGPVVKLSLDDAGFYRLRRLARRWRVADARSRVADQVERSNRKNFLARQLPYRYQCRLAGSCRAITSARSMLSCNDPALSAVRGVSGWIPQDVTDAVIAWLASEGHAVTC